jgi:hypothetical protein
MQDLGSNFSLHRHKVQTTQRQNVKRFHSCRWLSTHVSHRVLINPNLAMKYSQNRECICMTWIFMWQSNLSYYHVPSGYHCMKFSGISIYIYHLFSLLFFGPIYISLVCLIIFWTYIYLTCLPYYFLDPYFYHNILAILSHLEKCRFSHLVVHLLMMESFG